MNRVANMNPERRMKKLLSDRYENMSEERRTKKKEVSVISLSKIFHVTDFVTQDCHFPVTDY